MTSSTWFKIGFTGTGIFVVAALAPIVMAVLGHPRFSEHLGVILNEKSLSIILLTCCAVIFRAVMKKREESMLAYLEKRGEDQR